MADRPATLGGGTRAGRPVSCARECPLPSDLPPPLLSLTAGAPKVGGGEEAAGGGGSLKWRLHAAQGEGRSREGPSSPPSRSAGESGPAARGPSRSPGWEERLAPPAQRVRAPERGRDAADGRPSPAGPPRTQPASPGPLGGRRRRALWRERRRSVPRPWRGCSGARPVSGAAPRSGRETAVARPAVAGAACAPGVGVAAVAGGASGAGACRGHGEAAAAMARTGTLPSPYLPHYRDAASSHLLLPQLVLLLRPGIRRELVDPGGRGGLKIPLSEVRAQPSKTVDLPGVKRVFRRPQ